MMVRTVRRAATFLRTPWWISMPMTFFLRTEKLTAMWLRSLVSLPRGPSTVTSLDLIETLTVGRTIRQHMASLRRFLNHHHIRSPPQSHQPKVVVFASSSVDFVDVGRRARVAGGPSLSLSPRLRVAHRAEIDKRTVLGDLEGLLTVDVAHLCVGTG